MKIALSMPARPDLKVELLPNPDLPRQVRRNRLIRDVFTLLRNDLRRNKVHPSDWPPDASDVLMIMCAVDGVPCLVDSRALVFEVDLATCTEAERIAIDGAGVMVVNASGKGVPWRRYCISYARDLLWLTLTGHDACRKITEMDVLFHDLILPSWEPGSDEPMFGFGLYANL
jgi:hypothetical protein